MWHYVFQEILQHRVVLLPPSTHQEPAEEEVGRKRPFGRAKAAFALRQSLLYYVPKGPRAAAEVEAAAAF